MFISTFDAFEPRDMLPFISNARHSIISISLFFPCEFSKLAQYTHNVILTSIRRRRQRYVHVRTG